MVSKQKRKTPVLKPKIKASKSKPVKRKLIQRDWYLFDCKKEPLGRMATKIATVLRGKHKVCYAPYLDCGDFAVVINAENVFLTGKKKTSQKLYYHHTGYPGAIRVKSFTEILKRNPEWLVEKAVRGMLPSNNLRARMLKRLKVYRKEEYPAQNKVKEFKF